MNIMGICPSRQLIIYQVIYRFPKFRTAWTGPFRGRHLSQLNVEGIHFPYFYDNATPLLCHSEEQASKSNA